MPPWAFLMCLSALRSTGYIRIYTPIYDTINDNNRSSHSLFVKQGQYEKQE